MRIANEFRITQVDRQQLCYSDFHQVLRILAPYVTLNLLDDRRSLNIPTIQPLIKAVKHAETFEFN